MGTYYYFVDKRNFQIITVCTYNLHIVLIINLLFMFDEKREKTYNFYISAWNTTIKKMIAI